MLHTAGKYNFITEPGDPLPYKFYFFCNKWSPKISRNPGGMAYTLTEWLKDRDTSQCENQTGMLPVAER